MVVFRVRGVPVKVGWSWLAIVVLVFWSLGAGLFPATYPGLRTMTYFLMGAAASLLFFASILLHELSHTLWSLHEGVRVKQITLWLFGGVSQAEEPLPSPAVEFRVVAAGPLASAVLAGLFLGVSALLQALGLSAAWTGVPDYLGRINLLLLGFNVVPALPLDGGRLLHALLWWRSGDSATATLRAAVVGRAFAVLLVALGLVSVVFGDSVGGIWFVVLGWFLTQAVRQEVMAARVSQAFGGRRVRDLMTTSLVTVDPSMTIEDFADRLVGLPSHPAYPVVQGGELVGLLLLREAGAVPAARRATVRVADVMLDQALVPVVHPEDPVAEAAEVLRQEPGRAVVRDTHDGHPFVGLLSASDLALAVESTVPRRGRWGRG